MSWQSFVHALGVPGLRELPMAYGAIVLLHGGYLAFVLRGFRQQDRQD